MPPLLEVKDLRVSYGRLPALTGVDLVVPEGALVAMLALARAVGSDPTLLMADELSLGLAPRIVAQINDVLKALHEKDQRTILMVEQYATHALRVADLVYILGRGKLVWAGEPDELRASKVLVESYLGGSA